MAGLAGQVGWECFLASRSRPRKDAIVAAASTRLRSRRSVVFAPGTRLRLMRGQEEMGLAARLGYLRDCGKRNQRSRQGGKAATGIEAHHVLSFLAGLQDA